MIRWMLVGVVGVSLGSGCDSRQPTVREGAAVHEKAAEHPEADSGSDLDGFGPPPLGNGRGGHGQGASIEGVREVRIGRMQLIAPEDWGRKPPRSSLVLAEFNLPRVEGDGEDARLTVTSVGGSVDENIARWRTQFGGKVENESIEKTEVAGVQVALVDLSGAYSGQHGGVGTAGEQSNHRMLAAIIDLPTHQHVVKCYGPEKTVAKHADAFEAFIRSLSSPDGGPSKIEPNKEAPVEMKPAATEPTEEKPVEEKPAAEKPAEEKPAEEKPAEEKPAEEKPAEENVSDEEAAETP